MHHNRWPQGAMGHEGILLNRQDQFAVKPTANGPICVVLAAGVKAGDAWPPRDDGKGGQLALAVTPNNTGKPCLTWEECPTDAKALAAAGEKPFFEQDFKSEGGNITMITFHARAGVTYGIMPFPYSWAGSPDYRLAVYSMAPLEPIGPAAGVMQVLLPEN